ncbi:MAG: ATP-binding protein [Candidatus Eremiobacteraeota bacterium]|nr:ATP-binding protein [Candidatus Eremiobacteraeota bacterium]
MMRSESYRVKLIFLFVLQGLITYLTTFTGNYPAVIATFMLLGAFFALMVHRDLLRAETERKSDPFVEDDDILSKDPRKIETYRKEAQEQVSYLSSVYFELSDTVTEQKKKLEEQKSKLEEEKNRIEVILMSVPDGVITITTDGRIATWNPGARIITEYEDSQALAKEYHKVLYLTDKAGHALVGESSPVEECLSTGKVIDKSGIFLRSKSHKELPIDIKVAPIFDEKNHLIAVVAAFRDVSKKWEIEKMKEDFLAMVTHDLKSPLAAIVGYTNLLLHPRAKFSQDEQRDFLNSILGSVKILQFLIDNILESARLESGRIVYLFEDFELCALMREIEVMFTPLVNSKKLRLIMEGSTLWVSGDREKLREVLNNLISNAIKFTPEGGSIQVRFSEEEGRTVVNVADTGKGIPPQELPKIFQKFQQVKGEKRGTGLGLYIVKKILEDHGQTIEVKSTHGKGTEFTFTLKTGSPKEDAVAIPVMQKEKKKILIIEDSPEISNLIRFYLRGAGYETVQAFQGSDAAFLILKEKPDLITLDYNLPDITGEELIQILEKRGKKVTIPIIIVTANAKKTWEIPYDALLQKPLDEKRFLYEVARLLNRETTTMDSVEVLK